MLMAHDRVVGDEISLTHEFIAVMLGTRRPGVTEAVQALSKKGLIRTDRALIIIADREGLLKRAGKLYGVPEAEYDRLIG
jgi:Mn-dependent DtxR family transcriptional regulator